MNNKKRIIVLVIVAVLIVAIFTISLGAALYVKYHWRKNQEIEDYLSKYCPKNPSMIYADEWGIYFSDRTLEFEDTAEIAELNMRIYGITKDYIYFGDWRDKNKDKINVYRSNHSFENIKVVLSVVGKTTDVSDMKIRYETEDGTKYIYFIEEEKLLIDENYEQNNPNNTSGNEYYSYTSERDGFNIFSNDRIYIITDKKTGIERKISQEYIDNIEKDKITSDLAEMDALHLWEIYFLDDNIYIRCIDGLVVTLYEYDFENEKLYFFDWFVQVNETETRFKIYCMDMVKTGDGSMSSNDDQQN